MNFGINFGSSMMEMQSSANIADAQMGLMQGSVQKEQLLNQIGSQPAYDLYQKEKAIDLNAARLDTFEKMNKVNEKEAKKKKKA